jgi:hypothetical protein
MPTINGTAAHPNAAPTDNSNPLSKSLAIDVIPTPILTRDALAMYECSFVVSLPLSSSNHTTGDGGPDDGVSHAATTSSARRPRTVVANVAFD